MIRRKAALVAVPSAVALLALAGCGADSQQFLPWWMRDTAAENLPQVTGDFGEEPEVEFGETEPPEELLATHPIEAEEDAESVEGGDAVLTDLVSYAWMGPGAFEEQASTFESGTPIALEVMPEDPDIVECLDGSGAGTRVVCSIPPPEEAMQDPMQDPAAMPTTVAVFDIQEHFPVGRTIETEQTEEGGGGLPTVPDPGDAMPEIQIPDEDPPEDLEVEVLAQGEGPELAEEQQLVVQYTGVRWDDGEVFDSTWDPEGRDGAPMTQFTIGVGGVIEGWDEGLLGQNVGSRVMLVVPEDLAYGEDAEETGAPAGTLVFVIDLLAAVDPQPQPEPEEGMDDLEDLNLEDLELEDLEGGPDEDGEDDDES